MNKKLIITIAAAGLASFAAAFTAAWLTKPAPQKQDTTQPSHEDMFKLTPLQTAQTAHDTVDSMKKRMTEKQLKNLVYEVREKIQEYDSELKALENREQRLDIAQNVLKKDIEELNNLRVELASTIVTLKNEREKLDKNRVEIAKTERKNLVSIAATYDKMDSESAGKILTNMSQPQAGSTNDAVKILYYMSERAKAKLLAQLSTSEPELAAFFCKKLKQITEKE